MASSVFWITVCFAVLIIGFTNELSAQESNGEAIECYKCSTQQIGGEMDMTCLDNPESLNNNGKVSCPAGHFCILQRTEFTDIPGVLVSLIRDCEEKPLIENDIKTDAHYTKFFRACRTDKCNKGDGILALGPNGGSGGLLGDPIKVNGQNSSPTIFPSSSVCGVVLAFFATLTVRIFL